MEIELRFLFYLIFVILRARNEEYRRDMKVFLKSKRNAGVYMDTTVEGTPTIVTKDSVYTSLRQQDLHEYDSGEEI